MGWKTLDKRNIYAKELYKKRGELGLCPWCGGPPSPGKRFCQNCLDVNYLRRKKIKKMAVEYLGGKCKMCGIVHDNCAIYDIHHLNPEVKEGNPSHKLRLSINTMFDELDKCILLCSNCHRIIHTKEFKGDERYHEFFNNSVTSDRVSGE